MGSSTIQNELSDVAFSSKTARRKRRPQGEKVYLIPASRNPVVVFSIAALLLVLPFSGEGAASVGEYITGVVVGGVAISGIAFILRRLLGGYVSTLFLQALLVRLLVLALFYMVAGAPMKFSQFHISVNTLPVWDDDVHYVGAAGYLEDRSVSLPDLIGERYQFEIKTKVARIGIILRELKEIVGPSQVWVRVFHSLIGSVVVALFAYSLSGFFSPAATRLGLALCLLGPEFIQASVLLYKEVYVHLGTVLILCAMSTVSRSRRIDTRMLVFSGLGLLVLAWCRSQAFVVALPFLIVHVLVWRGRVSSSAALFFCLSAIFGVLLLLLLGVGAMSSDIETVIAETSGFQGQAFGWASSLSGFARLIHLPISFANPPPFLLHLYLFPEPGNYQWFRVVFRELRTLQWWIMLPWVLFGIYAFIFQRGRLGTFVLPYFCLWMVSAVAFTGTGPETVRYRDSFLPFAAFVAAGGYQYATRAQRFYFVTGTFVLMLALWAYMNLR